MYATVKLGHLLDLFLTEKLLFTIRYSDVQDSFIGVDVDVLESERITQLLDAAVALVSEHFLAFSSLSGRLLCQQRRLNVDVGSRLPYRNVSSLAALTTLESRRVKNVG